MHPFFPKCSFALSLMLLGGCAYVMDGGSQRVKFETPGARDAVCYASVNGTKYTVKPPQVVSLYKAKDDLIVDCRAPGNRHKKIVIEPQIEGSSGWNAANAGVGYVWDYASSAIYRYPDIIEVNFTDTPLSESPLPSHNNPDVRQPETYQLEEFLPGVPLMNGDKGKQEPEILKRERGTGDSEGHDDGAAFSESNTHGTDKGDLRSVIESLNPAAPSDKSSTAAPVPLYPGQ